LTAVVTDPHNVRPVTSVALVCRASNDELLLPGVQRASYTMPDAHWGYGFPIGDVAALDPQEGGIVQPIPISLIGSERREARECAASCLHFHAGRPHEPVPASTGRMSIVP
jgi:hypothetical protein